MGTFRTSVYIIEEHSNPSTDFFVLPCFPSDEYEITRFSFHQMPEAAALQNAIVVFVRYLPSAWRSLIAQNRAALKALYFFMDDDLLDLNASQGMPLRYRWKLARLTTLHQSWLVKQAAELWVSTPFLAHKYQAWLPVVIEPKPLKSLQLLKQSEPLELLPALSPAVKVFYHGSASHQAEIDWLYPIIKAVLEKNPVICFEVIGSQRIYKQFKGLERVHVVHPMSWSAYQCFIQQHGRHIGLAPLLPNAFNQARSYTKVFDITQAGAVGIYSEGSESAQFVKSTVAAESLELPGLVLPLEPPLWISAILELADDVSKRQSMVDQARIILARMDRT